MKNWKQKLLFTIHYTPFKRKAFTLAEVLITLGIIGVVSAITIPILQQNIQDKQFKEAAKAAYSKASQAVQLMKQDEGGSLSSYYGNGWAFVSVFQKHFKVANSCNSGNCFDTATPGISYHTLSGNNGQYSFFCCGQFVTADGMFFGIQNSTAFSKIFISVDVNGYTKGPNIFGRDVYVFELLNDNLVPMGGNGTYWPAGTYCQRTGGDSYNGLGCMANVMQGIDY